MKQHTQLLNFRRRIPDHWKIQFAAFGAIGMVFSIVIWAAPDPLNNTRCVNGVASTPINREWVLTTMAIALAVSMVALLVSTILAHIKSRQGCTSLLLTGAFLVILVIVTAFFGPTLGGYFCV